MQIVIEISSEMYNRALNNILTKSDVEVLGYEIEIGTVLPKGHGRLCDLDALWDKLNRLKKERVISEREFDDFATLLGLSPIVLKADKEAVDAGNSN